MFLESNVKQKAKVCKHKIPKTECQCITLACYTANVHSHTLGCDQARQTKCSNILALPSQWSKSRPQAPHNDNYLRASPPLIRGYESNGAAGQRYLKIPKMPLCKQWCIHYHLQEHYHQANLVSGLMLNAYAVFISFVAPEASRASHPLNGQSITGGGRTCSNYEIIC